MAYQDGWAAVNLEMPSRVPRVEFDAESHWALVKAVTDIQVDAHSPEARRREASRAFVRTWDYDIRLTPLIGHGELDAKRTSMGHSRYAAGGADYDDDIYCPFQSPEEALAFDPWATYGTKDCPGYFLSVTNMIPFNTPVENALYYNQVYRELSPR